MAEKKVVVKKFKWKRILIFLLALFLVVFGVIYYFRLDLKNIKITGTNMLTDNLVITTAGIKNYPKMAKISSSKIKKDLESLELVQSAKIKKRLDGKLTIEIVENQVLFINKNTDKIILSNESAIDVSSEYLGLPTLINFIPEDIYLKMIEGFKKIEPNVLSLVSEIVYSPLKMGEIVVDETRLLLRMNDGNNVYVNIVNIENLNNYPKMYAIINTTFDNKKGELNLDSNTGNLVFRDFETIARENEALAGVGGNE